jgi:hypothetical protein
MERLKLAAKNAKLTILVGCIGAALGIIGAGMIWGWGGVLLSFDLWLYTRPSERSASNEGCTLMRQWSQQWRQYGNYG